MNYLNAREYAQWKGRVLKVRIKKLLGAAMVAAMCVGTFGTTAMAEEANIALNKPVFFSSEEGTSNQGTDTHGTMAVDGDTATCWVAQTKTAEGAWDAKYPEWLCVDLGAKYDLTKMDIQFESKGGARIYDYKVYVSDSAPVSGEAIPSTFTMVLDKTDNDVSGVQPTYNFENKSGRYVLVEITKCNQYDASQKWQAAGIYELAVYGTEAKGAATEDKKDGDNQNNNAQVDNAQDGAGATNPPKTGDNSKAVLMVAAMVLASGVVITSRRKETSK